MWHVCPVQRPTTWSLLGFALGVSVVGCDGGTAPSEAPPPASSEAEIPHVVPPASAPRAVQPRTWQLSTSAGERIVIRRDATSTTLKVGDKTLVAGPHKRGRRYRDGDEVVVDVGPGVVAAVRGPEGKVLWRFSISGRRVRHWSPSTLLVAKPTYEVADGAILATGTALGQLISRDGSTVVVDAEGNDRFVIADEAKPSPAWGALLFDDLPESVRLALVTEVLDRLP
jgi:hypothetical protein